jgi:hypothetical protein
VEGVGDTMNMGRARKYATNADRQRAYRARQKQKRIPEAKTLLRKVGRPRVWPSRRERKHAWYMRKLCVKYHFPRDSFWAADVIRVALRLPVPPCFCPKCRRPSQPAVVTIPDHVEARADFIRECCAAGISVKFMARRMNVRHCVIRAVLAATPPKSRIEKTLEQIAEVRAKLEELDRLRLLFGEAA